MAVNLNLNTIVTDNFFPPAIKKSRSGESKNLNSALGPTAIANTLKDRTEIKLAIRKIAAIDTYKTPLGFAQIAKEIESFVFFRQPLEHWAMQAFSSGEANEPHRKIFGLNDEGPKMAFGETPAILKAMKLYSKAIEGNNNELVPHELNHFLGVLNFCNQKLFKFSTKSYLQIFLMIIKKFQFTILNYKDQFTSEFKEFFLKSPHYLQPVKAVIQALCFTSYKEIDCYRAALKEYKDQKRAMQSTLLALLSWSHYGDIRTFSPNDFDINADVFNALNRDHETLPFKEVLQILLEKSTIPKSEEKPENLGKFIRCTASHHRRKKNKTPTPNSDNLLTPPVETSNIKARKIKPALELEEFNKKIVLQEQTQSALIIHNVAIRNLASTINSLQFVKIAKDIQQFQIFHHHLQKWGMHVFTEKGESKYRKILELPNFGESPAILQGMKFYLDAIKENDDCEVWHELNHFVNVFYSLDELQVNLFFKIINMVEASLKKGSDEFVKLLKTEFVEDPELLRHLQDIIQLFSFNANPLIDCLREAMKEYREQKNSMQRTLLALLSRSCYGNINHLFSAEDRLIIGSKVIEKLENEGDHSLPFIEVLTILSQINVHPKSKIQPKKSDIENPKREKNKERPRSVSVSQGMQTKSKESITPDLKITPPPFPPKTVSFTTDTMFNPKKN